ncbi:MAG: endolytic transglycosylase MltG, partial [Myxococcota bacterium]
MKRVRVASSLGGALLLLLVVGGVLSALALHELDQPLGATPVTLLVVPKGAALRPTLMRLGDEKILAHPKLLYLYARLTRATTVLAGEYEISPTLTPRLLLKMLGEGRIKLWSLVIPEGLNRWQVRDKLVAEKWLRAEDFDCLCDDRDFLAAHAVPGPSCDGYLFPETYSLARGVPARELMGMLLDRFHATYTEVTARGGTGPLALSTRELVTLASIVEKETGAAVERPRIACVFY